MLLEMSKKIKKKKMKSKRNEPIKCRLIQECPDSWRHRLNLQHQISTKFPQSLLIWSLQTHTYSSALSWMESAVPDLSQFLLLTTICPSVHLPFFFWSVRTSWNAFVNPSVSWSTRKMSHCCSAIRDNISYHLTMTHTKTNTNKDKHKNKYKVLQRPNVCYIFEKHGVQGIQIWHQVKTKT